MRPHRFFILISLLLAAQVRADYPLELIQTIQLPPNVSWDVQHWMSDSTYGWACVNHDSISYRTSLADCTTVIQAPNYTEHECPSHPPVFRVLIFHSTLHPDEPTVAVMDYDDDCISGELNYDALLRVILPSGVTFGPVVTFPASQPNYSCMDLGGYEWDQRSFFAWPPPPFAALGIVSTRFIEFYCAVSFTHYSETAILNPDDGSSLAYYWNGLNPSVFSEFDQLTCVTSGQWQRYTACDQIPPPPDCYHWDSFCFYRRAVAHQLFPEDTICADFDGWDCLDWTIAAQRDSSGIERVILSNGECHDPVTFDTLWHNPQVNGNPLFGGRMCGSPDERILSWNGDRFNIFNAATGGLLGATDPVIGAPQYLLKLPNRLCEIVTYDQTTRIVRIYRSSPDDPPRAPRELTVHRFGQDDIRLQWEPVIITQCGLPVAPSFYIVYAATDIAGPFIPIGTSTTTTFIHTGILPAQARYFYYITAVTN